MRRNTGKFPKLPKMCLGRQKSPYQPANGILDPHPGGQGHPAGKDESVDSVGWGLEITSYCRCFGDGELHVELRWFQTLINPGSK